MVILKLLYLFCSKEQSIGNLSIEAIELAPLLVDVLFNVIHNSFDKPV